MPPASARKMAAWRNVAQDPELALVVAGLIDRVLEQRDRQLQVQLYDRTRRRNLDRARAAGLR